MDMQKLIKEVNKGGWKIEGFFFVSQWVRAEQMVGDGSIRSVIADDLGIKFYLDGMNHPAIFAKSDFGTFECVGGENGFEVERITVKGHVYDDVGRPTGELKAKLVLVNPAVQAENLRRAESFSRKGSFHRIGVERARDALKAAGIRLNLTRGSAISLVLPDGTEVSIMAISTTHGSALFINGANLSMALRNE